MYRVWEVVRIYMNRRVCHQMDRRAERDAEQSGQNVHSEVSERVSGGNRAVVLNGNYSEPEYPQSKDCRYSYMTKLIGNAAKYRVILSLSLTLFNR